MNREHRRAHCDETQQSPRISEFSATLQPPLLDGGVKLTVPEALSCSNELLMIAGSVLCDLKVSAGIQL